MPGVLERVEATSRGRAQRIGSINVTAQGNLKRRTSTGMPSSTCRSRFPTSAWRSSAQRQQRGDEAWLPQIQSFLQKECKCGNHASAYGVNQHGHLRLGAHIYGLDPAGVASTAGSRRDLQWAPEMQEWLGKTPCKDLALFGHALASAVKHDAQQNPKTQQPFGQLTCQRSRSGSARRKRKVKPASAKRPAAPGLY